MINNTAALDGRSVSYLAAKADAADVLIAQLRRQIVLLEGENHDLRLENELLKHVSNQGSDSLGAGT